MNLYKSFSIILLAFLLQSLSAQTQNFIIIFTDDQGYEDLGCFGSNKVKTPNIDNMAKEGLKLTSFYVASSVCSPSRAALLTGRMPKRVGVPGVLFPRKNEKGLSPDEITIAELLKEKDYATALVGKWHLGHKKKYLPLNQGFDSYFGIPYSNNMSVAANIDISPDIVFTENYNLEAMEADRALVDIKQSAEQKAHLKNKPPLMRGNEIIEYPCNQGTLTERYTNEAISFITENKDQPFFLYFAHSFPHVPIYAGEKFKDSSGTSPFYDAVQEIDWSVGEVLNTLKKLGLDENTIVVFTSDNGPNSHGSAKPLKGRKFDTYEGGQRVPAVVWAPSKIKSGIVSDEIVSSLDLLPTFAHYAKIPLPKDRTYDGYNISKFIEGKSKKSPRQEMYFYGSNSTKVDGIRMGDWKYVINGYRKTSWRKLSEEDLKPKLFNLKNDISESKNVISQHPEKAEELIKQMNQFDADIDKDISK
ncbi:sulfatase family protein [Saccharicrinis aurantiacus]|uniref:sulfatase family protein n=1 Tax=Saccharicrinis aurantiacus TaxID=1849719 RepID=UPI00094FB590|nr:sulfatase [Saccharicrinis aurantiacus]